MFLRYIDGDDMSANAAYVGLALPGEVGSWQKELKVDHESLHSFFFFFNSKFFIMVFFFLLCVSAKHVP